MNIIPVTCSIQDGSIGHNKIKQLESVITSTYQTHFGSGNKLVFFWLKIPYEQSYLAGKLSTASTVQIPVKNGMPNEMRHPFMAEVCAKWQHVTGCSKNEIILAVSDMSQSKAFTKSMATRFEKSARTKTQIKILTGLIAGKIKKGYLNSSVNL
ncbi:MULTISPECIES: hypothetical protein [Marinobacter]|uniref:hypothetical protein n=1 Tax=Marinobacter TaxID=2742 RepID=UPI001D06BB4B|nr:MULTISPECIES: hypothetical protein [Marinobacter]MCK7568633.1 hypothetical protein [Marinobacter xestospongiae]UDL07060.1 hypothetical protein J2887_10050 [Marinobacter sp. CA1]